jgi:hypothetical protein
MEGQKSGQKRHQDLRSSSKKKEELGKPWKTPRTMGRAAHSKGNKHARGFSLVKPNRRRIAVFVECRQLEDVLPLRIPKLDRFIFVQHFFS